MNLKNPSRILSVAFLAFVQCSSPQKWTRSGQVMVPQIEVNQELKQITQFGENSSPRFSPDGKKMVYVSRARSQHAYGQIYEMDLTAHKEQRITFQGAENDNPIYVRDGKWLLYSSATDETKERPTLLSSREEGAFKGPVRYRAPMDLYLHNLNQFEVSRLTSSPGFDGDPFWFNKNELVIFTRRKDSTLYLFSLHAGRPKIIRPFSKSTRLAQWSASQDGQSQVWVEWAPDFATSELKVKWPSGYVTLLSDFDRVKKDPYFVEDLNVILFSMNHPEPNKFNVFSINLDGTCLTQWTNNLFNNEQPTLSPDLKSLAFASDRGGSKQIYIKAWPQTLPCLSTAKPVK